MSTQAPDRAGPGACDLATSASERTTAERTRAHRVRSVLGWVLVAVAAILLWPAQWGGLTGLTIVSGQSMEPTYYTGDLVVTWRQADYAPGDIVSYTVPADQPGGGGHVIHRIVTAEPGPSGTVYTTLGDNNPAADQWAITAADITGTTILHVPGLGRVLGPAVLPIIAAAALGGIVTVLLWRDSEDDHGDPAQEDTAP